MQLRPYQEEWVAAVQHALTEHRRVLATAATGAGKTVMAAELIRRIALPAHAPALFLADAQALVYQAADKIGNYTDTIPDVEMADSHAHPGAPIVIATTQSIANRLEKYPKTNFEYIIVDEAHRNTLGQQARKVLDYFTAAKTIGITATPFRADKRNLTEYYEHLVDANAGLPHLIRAGFLARITVKSVPVQIDMHGARVQCGDFAASDLESRILPHIDALADTLCEHAQGRRTVAFLPLIESSKAFAQACLRRGVRAIHVDGTDSTELKTDWEVVSNACLLTTGWDEPSVDCVYICRPTKSLVMYSQMVGRGTRIHPGKQDLLLLDPVFRAERMDIMRPHRLVAETVQEAEEDEDIGDGDLLANVAKKRKQRRDKLEETLRENAARKAKCIDAVEFYLSLDREDLTNGENQYKWEDDPPSEKQLEILEKNGFFRDDFPTKGHASRMLDVLFARRSLGLATPKQIRLLKRFHVSDPHTVTFQAASDYITKALQPKPKPKPEPAFVPF
jgi:superfamily II DNA or RNA helicase